MQLIPQSVTLLYLTPDGVALMEVAGRTCYATTWKIEPGSARKFVQMIFRRGHHTILEHCTATFCVVCDRGVSHEFVRHRLMTFSQESTRFCNYSGDRFGKEIKVVLPPGLTEEDERDWREAMAQSERSYLRMTDRKTPPEIARSVLPQSLKTEFVVTANLREWALFLRQRYYGLTGKPHPQMHEVATYIRNELLAKCPDVFEQVDREAKRIGLVEKILGFVKDLRDCVIDPAPEIQRVKDAYNEYEELL